MKYLIPLILLLTTPIYAENEKETPIGERRNTITMVVNIEGCKYIIAKYYGYGISIVHAGSCTNSIHYKPNKK